MREACGGRRVLQALILALIAGYADSVGYLSFDAFAGMMTGNTILLAIALFVADPLHAAQYAAIILAFVAGVIVSLLLRRLAAPLFALLAVEGVAILVAAFAPPEAAPDVLAFAMGLQNAAVTQFAGVTLNTVFLTGNLQKLTQGLFERLWPASGTPPASPRSLATTALVWLGYLGGAGLGAAAHKFVARPLLLVLILLPLVALVHPGDRAVDP